MSGDLDRRPTAEPYGWWGNAWHAPDPLSVVQLIERGNFDARVAALLWLLIERRASIIVAADPPGAGKTTTLTALADFLPPDVGRLYLRGWNETFAFLGEADPRRTYLLCNEISPHLPVYLWGRKVPQLFAAIAEGYGLGATMHADTLDEVVATLAGYPLHVPRRQIAHLDLVLTLAVDYHDRRPRRRLEALYLLDRDGAGTALNPLTLAHWDAARGIIRHRDGPPPPALLRRSDLGAAAFAAERDRRADFLTGLVARGVREAGEVRAVLATFPATRGFAGMSERQPGD
ncbi:MAG: type II secretion system protein E [Chloroflexota bacterium]|nr:type II secretion system protein E [Chloroflexota bacterium]